MLGLLDDQPLDRKTHMFDESLFNSICQNYQVKPDFQKCPFFLCCSINMIQAYPSNPQANDPSFGPRDIPSAEFFALAQQYSMNKMGVWHMAGHINVTFYRCCFFNAQEDPDFKPRRLVPGPRMPSATSAARAKAP